MINRNNKYVSTDIDQLKKIEKRKRFLVSVSGILLTVTLLTGCSGKIKPSKDVSSYIDEGNYVEIICEDIDKIGLSNFSQDLEQVVILGTALKDISELSNYSKLTYINLSDNLITDVTPLESLPNLYGLNLTNNSVKEINLKNFPSLKYLAVEGNYNLYTYEILDYCKENHITITCTKEDVDLVEHLRNELKKLNLDGKNDLEKEKIIYDYVLNNMKYDNFCIINQGKAIDYNVFALKYAVSGKGLCVNYAVLFDAMCELSGINSYNISGVHDGTAHEWNLIEIDGEYMLCDPTWSDTGLPFNIGKSFYYNKTGNDAEKFLNEHQEGYSFTGKKADFGLSDYRSKTVLEGTSLEDKEADRLLGKVDRVITGQDTSKKDFIKYLLLGLGTGSVVLLSNGLRKILKRKVKKQQLKEKIIEKDLSKLPTATEKIIYLNNRSQEIIRNAAIKQLEVEDIVINEETIEEATKEIINISKYSYEDRIKYLINKTDLDYDSLTPSNQDEIKNYTINKYSDVEYLINQYNILQQKKETIKEEEVEKRLKEMSINKEPDQEYKRLGYIKIGLLSILTVLLSIVFLLVGILAI